MVVLMAVLLTSNKLSVMVKEKFETNNHLSYIHNTYDIYLSYAYNIYIYIYIYIDIERERDSHGYRYEDLDPYYKPKSGLRHLPLV